jgi:hypothetical protein
MVAPSNPCWPDKTSCRLPCVEPLPLINPNDSWIKRVFSLVKRTEFIITQDYVTHLPHIEAWCFIPQNFVYDFASVPRPFTLLFQPSGPWAYPAGPHDFGYRFGGLILSTGPGQPYQFVELDRSEIDLIFLFAADKANNLPRLNRVGYNALRLLGRFNHEPLEIGTVDWSSPVRRLA